jgi:hypothetical protein
VHALAPLQAALTRNTAGKVVVVTFGGDTETDLSKILSWMV